MSHDHQAEYISQEHVVFAQIGWHGHQRKLYLVSVFFLYFSFVVYRYLGIQNVRRCIKDKLLVAERFLKLFFIDQNFCSYCRTRFLVRWLRLQPETTAFGKCLSFSFPVLYKIYYTLRCTKICKMKQLLVAESFKS